jgi:esterase/lipase superfamily enzyme
MDAYHKWHSPWLGQDFELKVYGHGGKPMIVFPSLGGRFFDFENFGMVEACRPFLDEGRLRIFAIDGRDGESWLNESVSIAERGRRHEAWEACVVQEVIPFVSQESGRGVSRDLIVTGCSSGAFHAANFFFRHPDLCDTLIALSGVYSLDEFKHLGGYCDDHVYFNDPLRYMPHLTDPWYLNLFRKSRIILCVGQGPWEHVCLPQTRRLSEALGALNVPHWFDVWGNDVGHDWPWWRKQLPYFLGHVLLGKASP